MKVIMPTKQELLENNSKIDEIHRDVKQASEDLFKMYETLKLKNNKIRHEDAWGKMRMQEYPVALLSELNSEQFINNNSARLNQISKRINHPRSLAHSRSQALRQSQKELEQGLIILPSPVSFLGSKTDSERLDKIERMLDMMKQKLEN